MWKANQRILRKESQLILLCCADSLNSKHQFVSIKFSLCFCLLSIEIIRIRLLHEKYCNKFLFVMSYLAKRLFCRLPLFFLFKFMSESENRDILKLSFILQKHKTSYFDHLQFHSTIEILFPKMGEVSNY